MPKSYWMIFISSICLNQDYYDPELPPFHFLDSVSPHSLHFKKKKKIYPWVFVHIPECSFLCTDLLTCIPLCSFCCNLILIFKSSLHCKTGVLVFLCSFSCGRRLLVFLLHHLSSLTSIFCYRENNIYWTKKDYKIPVPTEYATREKLSSSSSTSSILLSSSFFLLFCSVYFLLLLFSFFFTPLYLCQFSLGLWPRNSFLVGVFVLHASKFL